MSLKSNTVALRPVSHDFITEAMAKKTILAISQKATFVPIDAHMCLFNRYHRYTPSMIGRKHEDTHTFELIKQQGRANLILHIQLLCSLSRFQNSLLSSSFAF